jgi:hypothetical protein
MSKNKDLQGYNVPRPILFFNKMLKFAMQHNIDPPPRRVNR